MFELTFIVVTVILLVGIGTIRGVATSFVSLFSMIFSFLWGFLSVTASAENGEKLGGATNSLIKDFYDQLYDTQSDKSKEV